MPRISFEVYCKQCKSVLLSLRKQLGPETFVGKDCLYKADYIDTLLKNWKEYDKSD